MQIGLMDFRILHQDFVFIFNNPLLKSQVADYPGAKEADGVIAYGFIDHKEGFKFAALACGKADVDGGFEIFEAVEEPVELGFSSVDDCDVVLINTPGDELKQFLDTTDKIDDKYDVSKDIRILRDVEELDRSRNPENPDIVTVMLVKKTASKPEACWVLMEKTEENDIIGTILSDVPEGYGYAKGDELRFQIRASGKMFICMTVVE